MSMSDFHLVDPQGWEYDLQAVRSSWYSDACVALTSPAFQVYSAYMGHFQLHSVPWYATHPPLTPTLC